MKGSNMINKEKLNQVIKYGSICFNGNSSSDDCFECPYGNDEDFEHAPADALKQCDCVLGYEAIELLKQLREENERLRGILKIMCQIVIKRNKLKENDIRDFIIYNVIFESYKDNFTVSELKEKLDELNCQIDLEYLKNKLISFAEKGLILQTIDGYVIAT